MLNQESVPSWILIGLGCLVMAAVTFLTVGCGGKQPSKEPPSLPGMDARASGAVLFLVTSSDRQVLRNGKERPTGAFLNELYLPAKALLDRGHQVVIATPTGAAPAIDPEGMKAGYWDSESSQEEARRWAEADPLMTSPLSFAVARDRLEKWAGVIIPGGQGVMDDVVPNPVAHEIVLEFARRQRPIGLICHAPALLIHLPTKENPLQGKRVTSVSPFEEFFIETFIMGGKPQTRKIGRQLRAAGFDYDSALPKANYAIRDGNLVSSQNPYSGKAFVDAFNVALANP